MTLAIDGPVLVGDRDHDVCLEAGAIDDASTAAAAAADDDVVAAVVVVNAGGTEGMAILMRIAAALAPAVVVGSFLLWNLSKIADCCSVSASKFDALTGRNPDNDRRML